jgi:excisionase family DNA binding protein
MPKRKKPSGRHIDHLGFTIPAFAEELKVPEGMVRRAVENKEVEFVWFGGLRRIPPREVERLRSLFKAASPA